MILAALTDPLLRSAVLLAARPDEDVIFPSERFELARRCGFPRIALLSEGAAEVDLPDDVPGVRITAEMLDGWEDHRRRAEIPPPRRAFLARRVRGVVRAHAGPPRWVDRELATLERAVGRRLPGDFRGFARRVLEFPAGYADLHALADLTELSRGALKARFRRRELASPYTYLRWLRVLAVAHALADPGRTVSEAARRLGFTSGGNLCRTVTSVTTLTPTELREPEGRATLLVALAETLLDDGALGGWARLGGLFVTPAA